MALRFLLDTNVVSELTKPAPNASVLHKLARFEADCAISAPTLEELHFGCARLPPGARQDWLHRWIAGLATRIEVLPYDQTAAAWLGPERARLAALGRPVSRADGEIAAVAVTRGLVLVTRNRKDFTAFATLVLQDWHGAGQEAAPPDRQT